LLSEAYGEEDMKKSSVCEWRKRFKEDHENMEVDEKSGRPGPHRTDVNVKEVRNIVHSDRRLSIRAMAAQLNLDKGTVRTNLSDHLSMKRISAKMVPRLLTDEQNSSALVLAVRLFRKLHSHTPYI